jgi:hypothetical protein
MLRIPHCLDNEVLTAVVTKVAIFRDIALCSPYMNQRFGGTYHLHLQDRKSAEQDQQASRWQPHWFLARLIFDPDDVCDTFLRNVGSYAYYSTLYSTRWQLGNMLLWNLSVLVNREWIHA